MASFSTPRGSGGSSKRGSNAAASSSGGRGRNASAGKGGDKGKASGGGVGGLITETVGCIVDEQVRECGGLIILFLLVINDNSLSLAWGALLHLSYALVLNYFSII